MCGLHCVLHRAIRCTIRCGRPWRQANYSCTTVNGTRHCVGFNATAGAQSQQSANQDNAFVDTRFGLDHWPLFNVGGGNAPLPPAPGAPADGNYDRGTSNVRSDSLVRWMVYSAVAFGAKGLNWYCW